MLLTKLITIMSNNITNNICEKVTEKLIEMIENGVTPWRKPWTGGNNAAVSHTTGKEYSLLNQILLGFRGGEYLTFNQVKSEGGHVKKGAKSNMIVFWASSTVRKVKDTDEDGNETVKTVTTQYAMPILKYYNVFHIDDCEGIKRKHTKDVSEIREYDFEKDTEAEKVAFSYANREGVELSIVESDRAYYRPSTDSVVVPLREQFESRSEFYSTLFHELTHSTGHSSRLDRFGKDVSMAARKKEYSREELVAEIGAATSLSMLGINDDESDANSAAYLKGWVSFLKNDNRAFIVAAGKAEKAVNMIFNIDG